MRVLIAEDELSTAKALELMLKKNKYSVDRVDNGADALERIRQNHYDVIALDIMMPQMDGLEVLKNIRKEGIGTPVILLTAKGELADKMAGFDAGADDYLPKPFAFPEFLARVKALSRRSENMATVELSEGNLTLDCNRYVLSACGNEVLLNNKEFQLMELFLRHPGFVYATDYLMEMIWGNDSNSNIDVVWTHIGFLRKKLKNLGADVEIKTVRGAGYSLGLKEV